MRSFDKMKRGLSVSMVTLIMGGMLAACGGEPTATVVAPTATTVISADFEFDVPVRFDTDQIDVRADGPNFFTWDSVPVLEIRV